ncbi:MAG: Bifunctional protein: zinc-containing alcohol dehydrogenase; quinone oxidoreductase (NADPH:quinone reductase); Similar to arginate lyase, partial [uncultured Craurococcus sp.]
ACHRIPRFRPARGYRAAAPHPHRARPAGRREGGLGEPGRHQGAGAGPAGGRQPEGPRLGRRRRGRGGGTGGDALPPGGCGVLCGRPRPPRHQCRVPPRRRADRRPQARHALLRRGRGAAADRHHGLGDAVRPARYPPPRGGRRECHPDHRRRRRRRLHRHPAGPAPDRADGHRHRFPRRDRGLGAGAGRAPCGGPREAAGGGGRGARHRAARLRLLHHPYRPASEGDRGADRAAGPPRPHRRPGRARHAAAEAEEHLPALGVHVHPLDVRHRRHGRARPAAGRDRPAGGCRHAAHDARREFRPDRRRGPRPGACPDRERPCPRQAGAGGLGL